MSATKLFYEDKLRVRVCALCFKENKILLVKHNLNGVTFYAPPGGAIEFGETMNEALKRELFEETNLLATSTAFKFITEYVNPPLHAIELFYHIEYWNGALLIGNDPESKKKSIIQDVKFYSIEEIKQIKKAELHNVLQHCNNLRQLLDLSGYIQPSKKI